MSQAPPPARPRPWPKIITRDPLASHNAGACDTCAELGRFTDGRPFCKKEPGEPCVRRLYSVIWAGDCRLGKHQKREPGV